VATTLNFLLLYLTPPLKDVSLGVLKCSLFSKDGMMQNFDGFDAMWIGLNIIPQHIGWTDTNPISIQ